MAFQNSLSNFYFTFRCALQAHPVVPSMMIPKVIEISQ